jgi:hypothetical protein
VEAYRRMLAFVRPNYIAANDSHDPTEGELSMN